MEELVKRNITRGGGGGYVSLRPVHHPRKSLSKRHPKRGWTARAHQARARVSLPNFLPFPRIFGRPVRGICEFDTLFSPYFPVFGTLNAIRTLRVEWWKRYPFYAFLFMRMMYRPQWDIPRPPPPPPPGEYQHQSIPGKIPWPLTSWRGLNE